MTNVLRAPARMAVWCAAAVLGALLLAGSAMAAPSAPALNPVAPTNGNSINPTWGASVPDPAEQSITYEGALAAADAPVPDVPLSSGDGVPTPDAGTFTFRVRAVQGDGQTSAYSTTQVVIDRTPPTLLGPALSGPAGGVQSWFRSPLSVTFATCEDTGGSGLATTCTPGWTTQGFHTNATASVADAAGNVATIGLPPFGYDPVPPARADLVAPGSLVPEEPTFRWFPRPVASQPDLSGLFEYQLQYRLAENSDGPWTTLAVVPDRNLGLVEYAAKRDPDLVAAPLPENVDIDWRVRTVDKAGNITPGLIRQFLIDPTVPPAPVITGGPVGPTQNTSPTFSWEGSGDSFRWDVLAAGSQNPIRSGNVQTKEVTIPALPDGAYTFRLTQFTPAGRESAEAVRSFVVDTTPPDAPAILTRPTFPSLVTPVFTWSVEPGAYSRWSVLGGGGAVIAGPTDTPVTSAELPALPDGAYSFQVQQIDSAGNVSVVTVEPFTVIAPLVPAPTTGAGGTITILPKQFAKRLQPKAGKLVTSRRPVLRWTRGPRGTKLFNLQIFRVTRVRGKSTPRVVKVLSVFPKGRAYRVPRRKTLPKTCYVWRVWPYTGREFTPKPLGVSNYCVASTKVMKKKAQIIAARKAARARAIRR